ncbi:MAG: cytochrome ubiquinol oxidase subunit I [Bacteroidota bacterium]
MAREFLDYSRIKQMKQMIEIIQAVDRTRLKYVICTFALSLLLLVVAGEAFAQSVEAQPQDYRSFFGLDSRVVVWIVAELHLMFAAFVLGVPIFAVIVEIIGVRTKDRRYDRLAHEFTKLLAAAFSTTAALGALLAFTLFGLYPNFMGYMTGIFHSTMYVYALLFFGEAFSLYLYYYSWERLQNRKWLHISLGVLLNVMGTALMFIANSWVTFTMSPAGVEAETGKLVSLGEAFANPLWTPINVHRLIANVCFGGFIVGAYAAIKFLRAETQEDREHYDWMGYVGNFIGVAALIPLPFAGYWLGREIYSFSAVMGNNMMGGTFSWTFIIQAILIGMLFVGANYYLWTGMSRIPGSQRYIGYIKYLNIILLVCFAVWLTPHNLPLSAEEQMQMGGQYHPVLKYLGLMSAKNAAVNFIILSTFFSFLLYRRANKGDTVQFSVQSKTAKFVLVLIGASCIVLLGVYAHSLFMLDPATLDLAPEKSKYFVLPAMLVAVQMATIGVSGLLMFKNRGILGQALLFAITVLSSVFVLGVYGFVVMTEANAFLRDIAVCQVLLVLSCLVFGATIDVLLFLKASQVGNIMWGKIPVRAQYSLISLCVSIVMLMGLMGFIRSGLREDWHVYGVLRDTSSWAFTPDMAYMSKVVALIVILFLGLVTFVFWLSALGEKKQTSEEKVAEIAEPV